ncbi:MAG: hypothetical protein GWN99_02030 [Gemmatimonadetes bacterium]|uniref:Peptidase C-terminal archaeal/bacterial domain-containing protein n=1 Tax=Candidatus Kutchimonas denitrificans TaxID=3056748 RepID=A0AAE4Z6G0_9BACT|nr:hypothetical protein [Gemmatimonadota bacterium]NIR74224.1 hypothetical protein [Candidatus Kutchimonas denitrificans]NIR99846.1 hypothetical protein [Gemmatimonadota bacterium]NIT65435.1 hypothetical protein [Gemmatimonadota bacterium]NIU51800.1 hypothetical protein [Gemmatimonadota bacterium]
MKRGTYLLVLAALALIPARGWAQSEWEQQVLDQIHVTGEVFASEGYRLIGSAHTGSLYAQASQDFDLTLEGGVHYVLVGVCDSDCSDIDLSIFDEAGTQLDSDYEGDAYPVVEVTPSRTATFRVHAYMANCGTEPCFFGVGVYANEATAASSAVVEGPNQEHEGRLDSMDDRINGAYFDLYYFQGSAGDRVIVDLQSSEFDPYLGVMAPSGVVSENDDFEGSRAHSRVEKELEESGEWTVIVTAYGAGATGAYQLSINTAPAKRTASKKP